MTTPDDLPSERAAQLSKLLQDRDALRALTFKDAKITAALEAIYRALETA
jgi:hypothetical protein